jgi:sulfur relay (sulfurtransferase) DsrC/TusE family protein
MPVTAIAGKEVHVNDEGFLTEYDEWNEDRRRSWPPTSVSR